MSYYTVIGTVHVHGFVGHVWASSETEARNICGNYVYDNYNTFGNDRLVVAAVFDSAVNPLPFEQPNSPYSPIARQYWYTNLDDDKYA